MNEVDTPADLWLRGQLGQVEVMLQHAPEGCWTIVALDVMGRAGLFASLAFMEWGRKLARERQISMN
jgi:hypothetical protein